MVNLNSLIITSTEYKVAFSVPDAGLTAMLKTLDNISWAEEAENELIYVVGSEYAVGNKQNAYKFSGKFGIQEGELWDIMSQLGLVSAIQIPGCILSISSLIGGPSYTFGGMVINTSGIDIKAKDKQSIRNLSFTAISIE